MAPRKNIDVENAVKAKKGPVKKRMENQFKSKLISPTTIKIKKQPIVSTVCKTKLPLSETPKVTRKRWPTEKKKLGKQEKLDLANEVAAAQLAKKTKPVCIEPKQPQIIKIKVPIKRPRRKKLEEPSVPDSDDAFEVPPVKKNVRKVSENDLQKNPASAKAKANGKKSLSLLKKKTIPISEEKDANDDIKTTRKKIAAIRKKPCKQLNKNSITQKKKEKGKTEAGPSDVTDNTQPSKEMDVKVIHDPPEPPENILPRVDSRKTSVNSEWSWTRDISSSSASPLLAVCSTDIVRIDKKLPVVKLNDIGLMGRIKLIENYPSSSSDSSCTKVDENSDRCTPDIESQSLGLSTSSTMSSSPMADNSATNDEINQKIDYIKGSGIETFDLEDIFFIGYKQEQENGEYIPFKDKSKLESFSLESSVIKLCERLRKIVYKNGSLDVGDDEVVPTNDRDYVSNDVNKTNDIVSHEDGEENKVPSVPKKSSDEDNSFTDKARYKSLEYNYDDDDALSLFAESLTGIDTSIRTSGCHNPEEMEEYVPLPLENKRIPAQKITYIPSIILNIDKANETKSKTVCEKQNADSTSIKESEQDRFSSVPAKEPIPPLLSINTNAVIQNFNTTPSIKPRLISHFYKPLPGRMSKVLRGVCFFNLLSSCKNINSECRFPHEIPSREDISARLCRLSEEMFIQEYMLCREWASLRRMYGMCFAEECKKRDLTRMLVEMAIDFIMKEVKNVREDARLKAEVVEFVLLHLTAADLDSCEDLLLHPVNGVYLCDVFMTAIANSANFSRFKIVFTKLTDFIVQHHRVFYFYEATQILERLSILPCEKPLLGALLEVVKHTDRKILDNPMMGRFEKQLLVQNELYEQLLELKKDGSVVRPVLSQSARVNPEIEPLLGSSLMAIERGKRYTSPDTTNLDNMNKATDEPATTQTVEFIRTNLFPRCSSNSSNDSDEYRAPGVPDYQTWRNRTFMRPRPGPRPPLLAPPAFGPTPPKFPKRSFGPDFY